MQYSLTKFTMITLDTRIVSRSRLGVESRWKKISVSCTCRNCCLYMCLYLFYAK